MSGGSQVLPPGPPAPIVGRNDGPTEVAVSRGARFAAVWLIGVGVLLASMFVLGFVLAFMEGFQAGYDAMDGIVVVVFSTVAAAHIAAGVGVWQGHRWGAVLGIVFAIIGLLFSLLGLLEEWFAVLPAAGYTAALVGLVRTTQAWWSGPSRS